LCEFAAIRPEFIFPANERQMKFEKSLFLLYDDIGFL